MQIYCGAALSYANTNIFSITLMRESEQLTSHRKVHETLQMRHNKIHKKEYPFAHGKNTILNNWHQNECAWLMTQNKISAKCHFFVTNNFDSCLHSVFMISSLQSFIASFFLLFLFEWRFFVEERLCLNHQVMIKSNHIHKKTVLFLIMPNRSRLLFFFV